MSLITVCSTVLQCTRGTDCSSKKDRGLLVPPLTHSPDTRFVISDVKLFLFSPHTSPSSFFQSVYYAFISFSSVSYSSFYFPTSASTFLLFLIVCPCKHLWTYVECPTSVFTFVTDPRLILPKQLTWSFNVNAWEMLKLKVNTAWLVSAQPGHSAKCESDLVTSRY
jgi:hypothetical protein